MTYDSLIEHYRYFLKDSVRKTIDFSQTDQSRGKSPPPIEKSFDPNAARIIELPARHTWTGHMEVGLISAIENRKSWRHFSRTPLTLEELSFLLWATQGIREHIDEAHALRTVPSAGARHALETYLCILTIEGMDSGFYRYLPLEHQLIVEYHEPRAAEKLIRATFGQSFIGTASVVFIWTTIPYRMEWRYGIAAHKVIAIDAGHVCQNLYLSCEAIGAGTCAIGAYDQEAMDHLLRVDGKDEFTIYLAPVGKIAL
ncbi:MAG: SagB/ThcOx family dehydrogenase [bacterium]